jgi:23S rRNA-/tRNA-specific pseudouridylate synthase
VAGRGADLQEARTYYAVKGEAGGAAWVEAVPVTGRTHQIRVHAQTAGCPVLGDEAYGGARRTVLPDGSAVALGRVMLHAAWVEIPGTDREVACPWPEDMATAWAALGGAVPVVQTDG